MRRGLSNLVGGGGGHVCLPLRHDTHDADGPLYARLRVRWGWALKPQRWAMPAFARTPMGERLMRDGLPQHYGAGRCTLGAPGACQHARTAGRRT